MTDPAYEAAWLDLKRRNRLAIGMFLGWIPFGMTVAMTAQALGIPERFVFPVLIAYMAGFAAAGVRAGRFPCPRCGDPFFSRAATWYWGYHNSFSSKCLNCGLPKNAPRDPGPEPAEALGESRLLGGLFTALYWPLVLATAGAAAGALASGPGGPAGLGLTVALVADLFLSLFFVASIKRPGLGRLVAERLPLRVRAALPALFALGAVIAVVGRGESPGVLAVSKLGAAATGITALYTAKRVRELAKS